MEVIVDHLGSVQFEVTARNHKIVCDQPAENGGFDEGMTPPELLLASLGTCAGFYAAQYLRKHAPEVGHGTHVRVTAEKAKNPARLENFVIEVKVPIELTDEHRAGIEKAVQFCLIKNTLMSPPKITLDIKSVGEASAAAAGAGR